MAPPANQGTGYTSFVNEPTASCGLEVNMVTDLIFDPHALGSLSFHGQLEQSRLRGLSVHRGSKSDFLEFILEHDKMIGSLYGSVQDVSLEIHCKYARISAMNLMMSDALVV